MSVTRDAYMKHGFIKQAIDLLADGTAWGGGAFSTYGPASIPNEIAWGISEEILRQIALGILIDGATQLTCTLSTSPPSLDVVVGSGTDEPDTRTIEIKRRESSFDEPGQAILEKAKSHIELFEEVSEKLPLSAKLAEPLAFAERTIRSVLSVPNVLTDITQVGTVHPQFLIAGLFNFQFEVRIIRDNIRFGFLPLAGLIEERMSLEKVDWDWSEDWQPQEGMCRYGAPYQVFLRNGIDLYPVKDNELGALEMLYKTGLVARSRVTQCRARYGLGAGQE